MEDFLEKFRPQTYYEQLLMADKKQLAYDHHGIFFFVLSFCTMLELFQYSVILLSHLPCHFYYNSLILFTRTFCKLMTYILTLLQKHCPEEARADREGAEKHPKFEAIPAAFWSRKESQARWYLFYAVMSSWLPCVFRILFQYFDNLCYNKITS